MSSSVPQHLVWLQLVRLPNLFTVPGDVIAGIALAGGLATVSIGQGATAVMVSLLLYAAGLLLNDWFDRHVDARERPNRPIPSGAVAAKSVCRAGYAAIAVAIALACTLGVLPAVVAVVLAILVIGYNAVAKKHAFFGPLVMAICRALNIGFGASLFTMAGPDQVFAGLGAAVSAWYILMVALIAVHEVDRLPSRLIIALLALTPILSLVAGIRGLQGPGCIGTWVVWAMFTLAVLTLAKRLFVNKDVKKTGPMVGALIRTLIFLQAFLVASTGASCYWIALVAVMWPAASWTGRKFYGS